MVAKGEKQLPDSLQEVKACDCRGGYKTKACSLNKLVIKFIGACKYCHDLNCYMLKRSFYFFKKTRKKKKKLILKSNMLQSLTQIKMNVIFLIQFDTHFTVKVNLTFQVVSTKVVKLLSKQIIQICHLKEEDQTNYEISIKIYIPVKSNCIFMKYTKLLR